MGRLTLGRGDFPAAREHLELARRLNSAPFETIWPLAGLTELAIWEGRYDDARAAVDEAVGVLERLDPEREDRRPRRPNLCAGAAGGGRLRRAGPGGAVARPASSRPAGAPSPSWRPSER